MITPPSSVKIWAVFIYLLTTMQIPEYKAKALYAHLKRIVECAKCDSTDTKTANALRLAKVDLRWLEKQIKG